MAGQAEDRMPSQDAGSVPHVSYLGELGRNWRPLLAATLGVGTGMSIAGTVTSALAPHLISGNGWARSDFALVGSLGIVSSLAFPFIGRIADVLGVRMTALIGLVALPLTYLAYSLMNGDISTYIAIFLVQSIICITTTATVYTRLAVQYITKARGLALAIVASGTGITGAIGGPLLNDYVESFGWRDSYQALAMVTVVTGVIVFLLIPPEPAGSGVAHRTRRSAREDYPAIFRAPAFWVLFAAMLLCNLPQVLMLTQFKLLLLDNGVSGPGAAIMFTALSVGLLAGRFLTGIALDRFNPYVVAFVTLGLPSVGLFIIASSLDAELILLVAVTCLGFAFGAEGDVVAFLVARSFGVEIYSSVLGLMTATMSASASLGAVVLSVTLARTGGFDLFLVIAGTTVVTGATLLLWLGRRDDAAIKQRREADDLVPST